MAPSIKKRSQCLLPPLCLFLLFSACPAHSQRHNSARIKSLGGSAVSGIIPDFYTDLAINPAYAGFADTLTLNYGYRKSPSKRLPFHYIDKSYRFRFPNTTSYGTSELLAYGIKLSGWRFSIASEWYLDNDDRTNSAVSQSYSSYSNSYRNLIAATHNIYDRSYWHFALSAAHELGGENTIGIRVGGTEYYYNNSSDRTNFSKLYEHSSSTGAIYLERDGSEYDVESTTTRWISAYLQIGLKLGGDTGKTGEIIFEIEKSPIFSRRNDYELSIAYDYEPNSDLHSYNYYLSEWRDRREGDLWTFAMSGRYTLPNGVRVYLGGELETSSYESHWLNMFRDYTWHSHITDASQSTTFAAEGDFKRIFFFAKAGKTYNIMKNLDITTGFKGFFERYSNSEDPFAQFSMINIDDQVRVETHTSQQVLIEFDNTMIEFLVPLALEYKPLGCLSCFACFSCNIAWIRNTEEYIMPFFIGGDENMSTHYGGRTGFNREGAGSGYYMSPIRNRRDRVEISEVVTIGFSLNYKGRFFLDLYTGSDITPDYISNMIIDARYNF